MGLGLRHDPTFIRQSDQVEEKESFKEVERYRGQCAVRVGEVSGAMTLVAHPTKVLLKANRKTSIGG